MSDYPTKKEIEDAMKNGVCYKAKELIGGRILYKGDVFIRDSGGYATVFPFMKSNGNKIAVRCWSADINNAKKRTEAIRAHLSKLNSSYFVRFDYIENALLVVTKLRSLVIPIVIMEWAEGQNLKEYLENNKGNQASILKVAENFKEMVRYFHNNNISHGDLSHGNIKVQNNGDLVVIDYDSMYINELSGMPDVIKGIPEYQHPARNTNTTLNLKLDYFSELVIYLSLLAYAYVPSICNEHVEWLLFSKEDFESPSTSSTFKTLLNCNNPTIIALATKLKACLKYNNILSLQPLEEMLYKNIDELIDHISKKF